jgi:hypothetical protein
MGDEAEHASDWADIQELKAALTELLFGRQSSKSYEKTVRCPKCGRMFGTTRALGRHTKDKHEVKNESFV